MADSSPGLIAQHTMDSFVRGPWVARKRFKSIFGPLTHITKTVFLLITLISLVHAVPDQFDTSTSCNPMVCSCSRPDLSANCSGRGFLVAPTGLPTTIRSLDLARNDLENVNATELSRLTELVSLNLSGNKMSSVSLGVHYQLQILDLSDNNISSVRSLHLRGLHALTELNLSQNKLISLPPNAFEGAGLLRILNLRGNRIVSLETGSLDNLTSLQELILTKNRLSSFPKGLFQHLKSLEVLELNKNKFVEIQGLSFHGLVNLKVLRLKRNDIEFLMDGAFYGLDHIEELALDRNLVGVVEKGWLYGLYTLKYLSLAFNRVEYITEDGWEFCHLLDTLDLRSNRLQLLDRDSLRQLPQLKHLHLQDNLISHIQDDDTFAEVPLIETLSLDGNEISHTIEDMNAPFRGLKYLKRLSLSRNQIKSIGKEAFAGLDNLEEINLEDNVISTVDKDNPFLHLTQLRSIHINSSSILCDCYFKWLPLWINNTGITGCKATCAHPENLKGRLVTSISYESYTCDDFPKPYILQKPLNQSTLKGNNLTLFCRAASTSPAKMNFEWKVDSETIYYDELEDCETSTERCIKNVDHSFDGKGRDITSQLHLTNLTYDDAGKYQCVVSNTYGATYSEKAIIAVYVYPQFVDRPEDLTIQGGARAELKCSASGNPLPNITWSKDSGPDFPAVTERRIAMSRFSDDNFDKKIEINSFVMYDVKAKDMGVYQCTATNPAGSISWNISLSVLEVPRFVKPMESKTVSSGETAVIECMASGSPKPRLTWTKDDRKLDGTEERHFFTADNQLLIIVKARKEDAGRYECTMHNQLGTESQSSHLQVDPHLDLTSPTSGNTPQGFLPGTSDPTTGIIIIAVVCCIIGTSLVWVFIIYKTRQRRSRRNRLEQAGGGNVRGSSFDVEWKGGGVGCGRNIVKKMDITGSPGEGEFDIQEHVRRGLLPSRHSISQTHLDLRTGLLTTDLQNQNSEDPERDSGTGDSKKSNENTTDEEDAAKNNKVPNETDALLDDFHYDNGAGESAISLSEFEIEKGHIPFADDEEDSLSSSKGPNSVITSDSNQGGGEGMDGDISMTSSTECSNVSKKSAPSVPEVQFRTFRPNRYNTMSQAASTYDMSSVRQQTRYPKNGKKRASAVELNGECYLALEPEPPCRSTKDLVEPSVYRGGVGSLPRHGLDYQQEMLEASLNSSDCMNSSRLSQRPLQGRDRSVGSSNRSSMFGSRRRRSLSRGSLVKAKRSEERSRKRSCWEEGDLNPEHSSVVNKSKEMFG